MRTQTQEQFRRRVKTWLIHRNSSVTALARRIGRNRCTVATAIHGGRPHPRVRRQIEAVIAA